MAKRKISATQSTLYDRYTIYRDLGDKQKARCSLIDEVKEALTNYSRDHVNKRSPRGFIMQDLGFPMCEFDMLMKEEPSIYPLFQNAKLAFADKAKFGALEKRYDLKSANHYALLNDSECWESILRKEADLSKDANQQKPTTVNIFETAEEYRKAKELESTNEPLK